MNWRKSATPSPPLFPFESQAVLGLVCVLCKCWVGGEHLISGILGAGLSGRGGPVDWLAQSGRSERTLSACACRCRSQVKVRRPRLPWLPLHPVPDFVALFSRTEGVSTPSGFLGVGMRAFLLRVHSRASGLQFLAGPGEEIRKETPCPAAGKA